MPGRIEAWNIKINVLLKQMYKNMRGGPASHIDQGRHSCFPGRVL
jgi:hypothetical protein